MTERREIEGVGYHYVDSNDDCLLVSQWIKRPDDLVGQAVPISKLWPRGVRCTRMENWRDGLGGAPRGRQPNVTFRFKIIIEIEPVKNSQ